MLRYFAGRLAAGVPVLFFTALTVFVLSRLLPGDPFLIIAGSSESTMTREQVESLRAAHGLDQPVYAQFAIWLGKILTGDFGRTFGTGEPVLQVILPSVLPTAQIAVQGWLLSLPLGLLVGVAAATAPNTWKDYAGTIGAVVGAALPFFLTASALMYVFAVLLRWLPASGYVPLLTDPVQSIRTTLMPSITLSLGLTALIARQTRSSLADVLGQPYIGTARSKGLHERSVVRRHALKNAMLPVLTIMGIQLGHIFGGAVITETIFAVPGLGRLMVASVGTHEYAVVSALVLLAATTVVIANILVDVLYGALDPRIRVARGR